MFRPVGSGQGYSERFFHGSQIQVYIAFAKDDVALGNDFQIINLMASSSRLSTCFSASAKL
jgi:hypothetical protein